MRYLIPVVLISFVTVSCSGPQTVARDETTIVTGYDFSEYTDQGFLFTPEQYLGEYQSIGLITVTLWPEVRKTVTRERSANTNTGYVEVEKFTQGDINVKRAIDEIYNRATGMGADAISRFDVTPTQRENGELIVSGVEISGFAIKRKN